MVSRMRSTRLVPPAKILRARTRSSGHSRADIGGALVEEWGHQAASRLRTEAAASPNASRIASTMPL